MATLSGSHSSAARGVDTVRVGLQSWRHHLSLQEMAPALNKILVPALGLRRRWLHHPQGPAGVVAGGEPGSQGALHVAAHQPLTELLVLLDTSGQPPGEAHQHCSRLRTSLSGVSAAMVNFPK